MAGRTDTPERANEARAASVGQRASDTIEELPPPRSWVVAPGQVRRVTMGTFRRRTPLTELLHGPRWLGDVSSWSTAAPSPADIPRWVTAPRAPRIRARWSAVVVLVAACVALFFASASLFVTKG